MALVLADRVRETTTVTGTGTATLLGAVSGYQSFAAVGNANTTYYVIANQSASEWEVGIGTYTSSGTTLSRTTVLSSSNSGSLVNFSAGTKDVFVDYPASKAVYEDASGNIDSDPITGGTLNGTTVGATTPAAGTFTTLTAQTGRLNGTGSNLLNWSSDWTQGVSDFAVTVTLASGTAPDSTNTANRFVGTNSTALHARTKSFSTNANITSVFSIHVKKLDKQYIQLGLDDGNTNGAHVNIDLDAVAAVSTPVTRGSGTGYSVSVTSLPSGWMRVALVGNPASNTGTLRVAVVQIDSSSAGWTASSVGNGTSGYYIWGAQLEINSAVSAYVATTSLPIYGTPTLSFSGVSGLGVQSDGSLYVQPAGTGALQAQATTSSATGGNARGANAVDWQTKRSAATQVASGLGSVICGGEERNTASGQQSFVGTGYNNNSSTYGATIVSGVNNSNAGLAAFIGAGSSHTIGSNGAYSVLVGGNTNTSSGRYNFIGGGTLNSGTSGSVVTSQATTAVTSGSTAVTLSASNGSIKVGQLINGTGMSENTYVAAISGTSLTLSQNSTATGTPTLSFFTPHGVVVGGGNNQATGAYSVILGGGDAGTAANRNVASGDWSVVVGGQKNTANNKWASVGGGSDNLASGDYSFVAGGSLNTSGGQLSFVSGYANSSSGGQSFIGGGNTHAADSFTSAVIGGAYGTTRGLQSNTVFPASVTPIATTRGASQSALIVLGRQTTDATSTASAAGTTNQVILPNNSAYYFKGSVIANVTGGGNTKAWEIDGAIKRGANAASTALVGTPTVTSNYADAGASTWAITATADTTNGGLKITFTGQASTTIRVVAKLETTEVTF